VRLGALDPKWWAAPGRHGQGIVFLCPHCRRCYLCVAFANPLDGGAPWDIGTETHRPISRLWDIIYGPRADERGDWGTAGSGVLPVGTEVVPPGYLWTRTGDTFEMLTLSPSVDASKAGCWHGFVTNGEVQ
jgi:uncharacterized protein DUF6527